MPLSAKQLAKLRTAPIAETGNRLAFAMDMLDIKQHPLADAVNLSQPYISDVCRGRHSTITLENAYKLAGYFGCTIEDLFPRVAA